MWVYPGTSKELVEDWCNRRTPWSRGEFKGEFDAVYFQTVEAYRSKPFPRKLRLTLAETGEVIEGFTHIEDFDGDAHVHEEDDSFLKIDYYEVSGIREPKVNILVLDALAAIR